MDISHVSEYYISNCFALSYTMAEEIICLTVHLSFHFPFSLTRTHTNLRWACCLLYSSTHIAKLLFAFIEFKGRFSWHCRKMNLKSNKGFFSQHLGFPEQYISAFDQNKTTTEGNFLWINQGTTNLPATARNTTTEAALVYGAEPVSATPWGFGRLSVIHSYLCISAASCGHFERKPSFFCKQAKILGTGRCSTQRSRYSQVHEPCQVGLVFSLCPFYKSVSSKISFPGFGNKRTKKIRNVCF